MKHLNKNIKISGKKTFSNEEASERGVVANVSSYKVLNTLSRLKRISFKKASKNKTTYIIEDKAVENFKDYNEFYTTSVLNFLDNLNSSKKYKNLEVVVDSPKVKI
jgi:hypothetical protein